VMDCAMFQDTLALSVLQDGAGHLRCTGLCDVTSRGMSHQAPPRRGRPAASPAAGRIAAGGADLGAQVLQGETAALCQSVATDTMTQSCFRKHKASTARFLSGKFGFSNDLLCHIKVWMLPVHGPCSALHGRRNEEDGQAVAWRGANERTALLAARWVLPLPVRGQGRGVEERSGTGGTLASSTRARYRSSSAWVCVRTVLFRV